MNTDRPPHGAKDEPAVPQTHILQTENGLGFLFALRWHRNHDIEDDTGYPSYGATALIAEGQLPGAHDLHLVIQALYAAAARQFFPPPQLDI